MAGGTRAWRILRWTIVLALVVANVAVLYAIRKVDDVQDAIAETFVTVPEMGQVLDEPPPPEDRDPVTILVLGSDSRENLPDELLSDFGDFGGQRADVIMLMQLIPDAGRMRLLSIPRDLKVDIEGYGSDKLNAAYAYGGAPLMVDTVRNITGLPIHHYLEVDFVGFAGLVDELGGVVIDFPHQARDLKSGLSVEAGRQRLDGITALAYARSRSYQELRDGSWTSVAANDLGRTQRQQDLVLAIMNEARSPTAVLEVDRVISRLGGYVSVDPGFLGLDFVDLGLTFRSLGTDDIDRMTLPTESVRENGIWYEVRSEPAASEALSAFLTADSEIRATPTTSVESAPAMPSAAELALEVLNGNGRKGAAGEVATMLEASGFTIDAVGDADHYDYGETLILATSLDVGEVVASALGFGSVEVGSPPDGYDVVVIVGADR